MAATRKSSDSKEALRQIKLFHAVEHDELKYEDLDFSDLSLRNPEGESLLDVASKNINSNALDILIMKKQDQGFAHHLDTLDGRELYKLVIRIDSKNDLALLDFFSSEQVSAKAARKKIFDFINDENVTVGMLIETVEHKLDNIVKTFTRIYQYDQVYSQRILAGIGEAKKVVVRYEKDCKNAEELFNQCAKNELKGHFSLYSHNIELLTIFKNKLLTAPDNQKLEYYKLLFNLDKNSKKPQLNELFYYNDTWKSYERAKLVMELSNDCLKLMQDKHQLLKLEKEEIIKKLNQLKQDEAFNKGVAKLIQAKSKKSVNEEKLILLTPISLKDKVPTLFHSPASQNLPPAPIKRLGNSVTQDFNEKHDQDELDEQVARAKV